MRFGLALELSNVDLLDTHLDLLDTDIPSKYFVSLHSVFKTCLQDVLEDVKLLRWRRVEDVLKTCLEDVLKTSSRPANVFWVGSFGFLKVLALQWNSHQHFLIYVCSKVTENISDIIEQYRKMQNGVSLFTQRLIHYNTFTLEKNSSERLHVVSGHLVTQNISFQIS